MCARPALCVRPALRGPRRQRGISFMELVLFMVIVGVALTGILSVMNLTTRTSSDPLVRKQALMLAEGFMEEVQLARYTYCDGADDKVQDAASVADCTRAEGAGPESGETRPYDNINDYIDSYGVAKEAFNINGALSDAGGEAVGLPGYTVKLTVAPTALLGPASARVAQEDALAIRVAVFYNGAQVIALDGYRLRYAPNSPP